MILKSH